MPKLYFMLIFLVLLITGCGAFPQAEGATPTRNLSAPTLAPTATTFIRNSDELYGDTQFGDDGQNNLTAAALPNSGALPPLQSGTREPGGSESVQLILNNGQSLLGDMYEQINPERRVPGILIIGRDRLSWGLLPAELFAAGFTVLVVELPPETRVEDLDVVLTSFSENGTVDPGRIAVIGAEETADMTLPGCAAYPICDAAVLLTPQQQEPLVNSLSEFSPRPLFIATSHADEAHYATASALVAAYVDGTRFVEFASGEGTALLALNSDLSAMIVQWLKAVFSN
jgi:hypothetical protein